MGRQRAAGRRESRQTGDDEGGPTLYHGIVRGRAVARAGAGACPKRSPTGYEHSGDRYHRTARAAGFQSQRDGDQAGRYPAGAIDPSAGSPAVSANRLDGNASRRPARRARAAPDCSTPDASSAVGAESASGSSNPGHVAGQRASTGLQSRSGSVARRACARTDVFVVAMVGACSRNRSRSGAFVVAPPVTQSPGQRSAIRPLSGARTATAGAARS